ncbi:MAG: DUF6765 family protein [Burkholderiaceae bacterium]|jgi:hypothetical protein
MRSRLLVFTIVLLAPLLCHAYEADVHFGLTRWLALQAGFTPFEADSIAIGDQRVDSGDMQYIELLPTYDCLGKNTGSAEVVRLLHYPSEGKVPAPPGQRIVAPDSEIARSAVVKSEKGEPDQAVFRLYLMGAALHTLQDSWAHQGVPDVPSPMGELAPCDDSLAWAHSRDRGGWNSHKADLAVAWPADAAAMAEATYTALQHMPAVMGAARSAKPWDEIRTKLEGFLHASTKTDKQKWFKAQGFDDVSFLEGISLPDGAERFEQRWSGRRLPPLTTLQSTQHHIDQDVLDAMSRFFTEWMTTTDFDALAASVAGPPATGKSAAETQASVPAPGDKLELAARLRAWRIRDHGRIVDLAHSLRPLSPAQRSLLASLASDPRSLATYGSPTEAYFPLLVKGPEPSPLLAFVLYPIANSASGNPRVIAVTKFRHAPYDTVEVLAERFGERWCIGLVRAVVDH